MQAHPLSRLHAGCTTSTNAVSVFALRLFTAYYCLPTAFKDSLVDVDDFRPRLWSAKP